MTRVAALLFPVVCAWALGSCGRPEASSSPGLPGGAGPVPAPASAPPPSPADAAGPILVYSGRSESLVGPLFARFRERTGRAVEVRYGETAGLAATILEEGDRSPCDVYVAQDAGALGELSGRGVFRPLDAAVLDRVPAWLRSNRGDWVGLSGRARVAACSTARVAPADLPASIEGFTDPKWKGRVGWAPMNGSFQAFVTALRARLGEDRAGAWLAAMKANGTREYPKNGPAVEAVARGEIDVALVNHYYLFQFLKERGDAFPVRNHFFPPGDAGNLVNVSGAGVLAVSKRPAGARALLEFLLDEEAQTHFARETVEYPVAAGVAADPRLPPLAAAGHGDLDLNRLADLRGTLALLRSVGILP